MVNNYEKYCEECLTAYNVKQDDTYHQRWHVIHVDVKKELENDKK